jgi:nucleotide-binding universal stress UspA family protein
MIRIKNILFPVDFSERCSAAAHHAAATARHFDAKLTVLHVLPTPPVWYGDLALGELELLGDIEQLKKVRQHTLDAYLRSELQNVSKLEKFVENGDPAHVITEYAHKEHVDLIMMPTHGHGPFRRLLLGSVTAKVLHDAPCSVWTDVHYETSFARLGCQAVMCAVDLRAEAVTSMQWAAAFAGSHKAELTLMHAIPALDGPAPPGEEPFRAYLHEYASEYITGLQRKTGITAKVCIEGGKVAETVRNAALHHAADLVVIGQGCCMKRWAGSGPMRIQSFANLPARSFAFEPRIEIQDGRKCPAVRAVKSTRRSKYVGKSLDEGYALSRRS